MTDLIDDLFEKRGKISLSDLIARIESQKTKVAEAKAETESARQTYEHEVDHLAYYENLLRTLKSIRRDPIVIIRGKDGHIVREKDIPEDYSKDTMIVAAKKVLTRAKKPLHVKDIALEMKAGSFGFRAENPARSVEVALQKHDDTFEKVEPHVFKLREDVAKE